MVGDVRLRGGAVGDTERGLLGVDGVVGLVRGAVGVVGVTERGVDGVVGLVRGAVGVAGVTERGVDGVVGLVRGAVGVAGVTERGADGVVGLVRGAVGVVGEGRVPVPGETVEFDGSVRVGGVFEPGDEVPGVVGPVAGFRVGVVGAPGLLFELGSVKVLREVPPFSAVVG
jgi:hypothetical protein